MVHTCVCVCTSHLTHYTCLSPFYGCGVLPCDPTYPICVVEYKTDPYGEGNPMNAICSRGDLLPKPEFGGCYDTKVSVITWGLSTVDTCHVSPT